MTRADLVPLRLFGRYGVVLALILLLAFGAWRYDNFLGAFNILSFLRYNSMFALVALGMAFVIMTGGIDLSVGAVAALGSVVAALVSPYGIVPGLLAGMAAGLAAGIVNGFIITRLGIVPFIATLATMLAAGGMALLLARNQSVSVSYESGFTELGQGNLLATPLVNGIKATMASVNDRGGINGRKINYIAYDDAYSPPKAVEHGRKLVESDEVSFMFGQLGTPGISAAAKYLRSKGVPSIAIISGSSKFTDVANYPMTTTGLVSYDTEGKIYAKYLTKTLSNAKYAILYQNDDLGKDYLNGIKAGLGDKAAKMIVAEASYEVADPTIDSQILKIKDAGADLFFSATTPKQAAQAIKKIHELNWKPVHILDINATSVGAVMKPAGLEASKGVISVNYGKDPLDPTWKDDPGMKKYFEFMAKYYPDGDKDSSFNSYGYSTSQLMIYVLQKCGDNLTRENVMKQATSLKDVVLDLSLPGIVANTSPTDYRVNKQLQMMRFNGERWELFGPILEDKGTAG